MSYYDRESALSMDYSKYMEKQSRDIGNSIQQSTDRIDDSIVRLQTGIQTAIDTQTSSIIASNDALGRTFDQGFNRINNTLDMGFSGVSNKLGCMSAAFSLGLDRVSDSIKGMSKGICDRLDAIHDIVNNPLLTQSRELFRRAFDRYADGFYDDSLEDIKAAVEKNKTDYISWFLMGKIYAFGAGKFSNVINLEEAIKAFTQAAKYNDPNVKKSEDSRFLEAEIYFYLGLAQYAQSNELSRIGKKAETVEMLGKALDSFEQSFQYSDNMYESLFNIVRCKVLQGQKKPALVDLEKLILLDRNYCIKVLDDNDFSDISDESVALINSLKQRNFVEAEAKYKKITGLITELKTLDGQFYLFNIPAKCAAELPYFDVMDYNVELEGIILKIETAIHREELKKYFVCISTGNQYTVALKTDGTVVAVGRNKEGQCNISGWRDIVAVSAGSWYTVGLKADGTVVAVGQNDCGQCNVSGWRDIVAISTGYDNTVGLKADGTVVAVGRNNCGQCNVSGWRDIVAVSAGLSHTVGLKADGTVVAVGDNKYGLCNEYDQCNVSGWRNIVPVDKELLKKQAQERQRQEQERQRQEQQRQAQEQQRQEQQRQAEQSKRWEEQGLCRYCGGQISGLFTKKCKSCGKTV
jgi:tetratricopeptide (TPR) repeat protein